LGLDWDDKVPLAVQESWISLFQEIKEPQWGQTTPQMGRQRVGIFFQDGNGKGFWVYKWKDLGPN